MIGSILLILMTMGCDAPAGSAATNSPTSTAAIEQALVEPPAGEQVNAEPTLSGDSGDGFGTLGELDDVDDPFASIGSAFSGLGFQSYSSSCDPFEDAYGTCL